MLKSWLVLPTDLNNALDYYKTEQIYSTKISIPLQKLKKNLQHGMLL